MCEDSLTDRTGPHPKGGRKLRGLRMTGQMLPQASLVNVMLATYRARVVRRPPLR